MSQAPSMPLFCGDYISDTQHFTLEQHGAYLMLLMVTWRNNGQPLPDDDDLICRYLHVGKDRWIKKIRPAIEPKFDLSEGTWRSVRLEKEWKYVAASRALQSEKGKKSAQARALKNNETDPTVVDLRLEPEANPQPQPQPQLKQDTEASASVGALPPAPAHELSVIDQAKKPRKSQKVKSKLPKDWALPMEWGQWAMGEGAGEQQIRRAADRFKSHHVGSGTLKADWREIWCNWIRSDLERNSNVKPSRGNRTADLLDGLAGAFSDCMDTGASAHNVVPLRLASSAF